MNNAGNKIEFINSVTETLFDIIVNLDKSDVANIHERNCPHVLAVGEDPEDIHLRVGLRADGLDFISVEPKFHAMIHAWTRTAIAAQLEELQSKLLDVVATELETLGYNYTEMHTDLMITVGIPQFDEGKVVLLFMTNHAMNWKTPDPDTLERILRKMVTMHTSGVEYLKDVFLAKINQS